MPLFFSFAISAEQISADSSISVFSDLGPFEVAVSSDWLTATILFAPSDTGEKKSADTIIALQRGLFYLLDPNLSSLPKFLTWMHTPYFVNIPDEANIDFSVVYYDQYGNAPSAGYPKAVYWPVGTLDYTTLQLEDAGTSGTGTLYKITASLPVGAYYYKYCVRNDQLANDYELAISSFVVSKRPRNIESISLSKDAVISNAKLLISWQAQDPQGAELTYKLYLGKSPETMTLLYEGTTACYEICELLYAQDYYWQVEAVNSFGVSSKSQVYKFSTILKVSKAFNYPNPFNPHREITNFVFNMVLSGYAEISVFTELGDLCWQKTFENLSAGANEAPYDGKDDFQKVLFNGSYVCVIKKNYNDGTGETDKCRLLIIK
ncbi:MAG: hypothetical protein A2339_04025 [Elusimicrobia bacterium RIFOXYB12_FULL_50_12]|nr:MAG: hypothetical protein A2386_07065 [Elusimicrobia bacterium RIFOXYB1_FULL_48_9]OGS16700.1 MAG: hypothetical protein A2251_00770 [Elusimicrobia bacterium RIFOXYA2_FULL_47_53]OGS26753.1 MAG: hypothetical protein A2339_04025 [Elusimicrobia bacterium RIFOXYB12_FULL_50_12]OGS31659.1 MAG: hypothetical protein A2323_05600 [Elusimicrobia bacterium RIFOXYB2_FULL_46_23]